MATGGHDPYNREGRRAPTVPSAQQMPKLWGKTAGLGGRPIGHGGQTQPPGEDYTSKMREKRQAHSSSVKPKIGYGSSPRTNSIASKIGDRGQEIASYDGEDGKKKPTPSPTPTVRVEKAAAIEKPAAPPAPVAPGGTPLGILGLLHQIHDRATPPDQLQHQHDATCGHDGEDGDDATPAQSAAHMARHESSIEREEKAAGEREEEAGGYDGDDGDDGKKKKKHGKKKAPPAGAEPPMAAGGPGPPPGPPMAGAPGPPMPPIGMDGEDAGSYIPGTDTGFADWTNNPINDLDVGGGGLGALYQRFGDLASAPGQWKYGYQNGMPILPGYGAFTGAQHEFGGMFGGNNADKAAAVKAAGMTPKDVAAWLQTAQNVRQSQYPGGKPISYYAQHPDEIDKNSAWGQQTLKAIAANPNIANEPQIGTIGMPKPAVKPPTPQEPPQPAGPVVKPPTPQEPPQPAAPVPTPTATTKPAQRGRRVVPPFSPQPQPQQPGGRGWTTAIGGAIGGMKPPTPQEPSQPAGGGGRMAPVAPQPGMPAPTTRDGEDSYDGDAVSDKIRTNMHEMKAGKLHSGSKHGPKVTNPKQAIAISFDQVRRGKADGNDGEDGE